MLSAEASILLVLVMAAVAIARIVGAVGSGHSDRSGKILDAFCQLGFAAAVAVLARRFLAAQDNAYAHNDEALLIIVFVLALLASIDIFRNALRSDAQRAGAQGLLLVFAAVVLLVPGMPQTLTKKARYNDLVLMEMAASNGPTAGEPGQIPDFLDVTTEPDGSVVVYNKMDRLLLVNLSRYIAGPPPSRCEMVGVGRARPGRGSYINAYQTLTFAARAPGCAKALPLEFEVSTGSLLRLWRTKTLDGEPAPNRVFFGPAEEGTAAVGRCAVVASSDDRSIADLLACAREQQMPVGTNWALTEPWRQIANDWPDPNTRISAKGYCFTLRPPAEQEHIVGPLEVSYDRERKLYRAPGIPESSLNYVAENACDELLAPRRLDLSPVIEVEK